MKVIQNDTELALRDAGKEAEANLSPSPRGEIGAPDNGQGLLHPSSGQEVEKPRRPGRPRKGKGRGPYRSHKKPHQPNLQHGLYIARVNPGQIDRRTRLGKALKVLKRELEDDLGGFDALSIQERLLLDRIIYKSLRLSSFEAFALEKPEDANTEKLAREYVALSNSMRLDLIAIGLQRRERDITPLSERLAALAARSKEREGSG